MEIGFENRVTSPEENRNELNQKLIEADTAERVSSGEMASKDLLVPPALVKGFVRAENAIILAFLTKNSSTAVKQTALEALEPDEDTLAVAGTFLHELVKKYAPRAFNDPFMTACVVYGGSVAIKVGQVKSLVDSEGGN